MRSLPALAARVGVGAALIGVNNEGAGESARTLLMLAQSTRGAPPKPAMVTRTQLRTGIPPGHQAIDAFGRCLDAMLGAVGLGSVCSSLV